MFARIYMVYEKEAADIPFICREGCATCCTQSVTMTTAEGELIHEYLAGKGRRVPDFSGIDRGPAPRITTNGLAANCLSGHETEQDDESPWIYAPCLFLKDERCTIYKARPFACRSFGSTRSCIDHGIADVPEWFVTLNIVVNQLIEHLDRGGLWGNMYDVLDYLDQSKKRNEDHRKSLSGRLLKNRPVPGFLVPPGEEKLINGFLGKMARAGLIPHHPFTQNG